MQHEPILVDDQMWYAAGASLGVPRHFLEHPELAGLVSDLQPSAPAESQCDPLSSTEMLAALLAADAQIVADHGPDAPWGRPIDFSALARSTDRPWLDRHRVNASMVPGTALGGVSVRLLVVDSAVSDPTMRYGLAWHGPQLVSFGRAVLTRRPEPIGPEGLGEQLAKRLVPPPVAHLPMAHLELEAVRGVANRLHTHDWTEIEKIVNVLRPRWAVPDAPYLLDVLFAAWRKVKDLRPGEYEVVPVLNGLPLPLRVAACNFSFGHAGLAISWPGAARHSFLSLDEFDQSVAFSSRAL